MSKTSFKKIEIKEGAVYAEWSQQEVSRKKGGKLIEVSVKKKVKQKPHHNFEDALQRFVPHFMFRTELATPETLDPTWFVNTFLDDERFEGITVKSITIGKNEESMQISVEKETSDGAVANFTSPSIPLVDGGEYIYKFMQITRDQLKDLVFEAEEYYFKEKYEISQVAAEL